MEYEVISHEERIWLSAPTAEGVLVGAREAVDEEVAANPARRSKTVREGLFVTCNGIYDGALTMAVREGRSRVEPQDDVPLSEEDQRVVMAAVTLGKEEIVADVRAGKVPRDVESFSALHDHVDANEYGGLCDADWDWDADPDLNRANAVQGALDAWIKGGSLKA